MISIILHWYFVCIGQEFKLWSEYCTLYHFTCSNGDRIWLILDFAVNLSYNGTKYRNQEKQLLMHTH